MLFFIRFVSNLCRHGVLTLYKRLLLVLEETRYPRQIPNVKFGKFTYGQSNISFFFADDESFVEFGSFSQIGRNLQLYLGGNHKWSSMANFPFGNAFVFEFPIAENHDEERSRNFISVGSDVWIGDDVSIMPGVTIGHGAVIAKRSHVVSDVPPFSIYGGNPAKFITFRHSEEVIKELLSIEWWNWESIKINRVLHLLTSEPHFKNLNILKRLNSEGF